MDRTHIYQLLELPDGGCDLRSVIAAHPAGVGEDVRDSTWRTYCWRSHLDGGAAYRAGHPPTTASHTTISAQRPSPRREADSEAHLVWKCARDGGGGRRRGHEAQGLLCGRTRSVDCSSLVMAPEMLLQVGHGVPVDLWALGVLAFELLHRHRPFEASEAPSGAHRGKRQSERSREMATRRKLIFRVHRRAGANRCPLRSKARLGPRHRRDRRLLTRDPSCAPPPPR